MRDPNQLRVRGQCTTIQGASTNCDCLSSVILEKKRLAIVYNYIKIHINYLPNVPAILMQDVAGNRPSRPFRPPMHGDSRIANDTLLWNGSSHALFLPLFDTHLKQSMPKTAWTRINKYLYCAISHGKLLTCPNTRQDNNNRQNELDTGAAWALHIHCKLMVLIS